MQKSARTRELFAPGHFKRMPITDDDLNEKMSELYVAECNAAKARLEVETECRRLIADNYEKVLGEAKEYSKKLEAPILAKISDVGYFCDAHVVRTNQVTMEMGASYYVECSVHTAGKIIDHRVSELRRVREDGLESIRLIDDKIKFCQENFASVALDGNPVEIVEKYDDEMERMFYENRKKNKDNKEVNPITPDEKKLRDREYKRMMDRLSELELLERKNDEVEKLVQEVSAPKPFELPTEALVELEEVEEDDSSPEKIHERLLAQPGVSQKEMESLLKYLDACDEESFDEEAEEDEEESEKEELDSDDFASDEDVNKASDQKVTEIETKKPKKKAGVRFAQKLEEVKTFHQTDMVELKKETPIETKSILRNTEPTPVDPSALLPEQKELAAMSTVSFPGEIVEKDPYECQPSTSKDPAPVITEGKVSKFRASRKRN